MNYECSGEKVVMEKGKRELIEECYEDVLQNKGNVMQRRIELKYESKSFITGDCL